ncbi:MAG: hypothetical protein JKY52_15920 [Flavobacteriales bacterium]|nr:hypothetical protein [Flavobacteriales bacterium]
MRQQRFMTVTSTSICDGTKKTTFETKPESKLGELLSSGTFTNELVQQVAELKKSGGTP